VYNAMLAGGHRCRKWLVPLGKDIETGVELWEATERLQEALHHKETEDTIMKLEYDGLA
jgi:hypothetical protein